VTRLAHARRRLLAAACVLACAGLLAVPISAKADTAPGQPASGAASCLAGQSQLVQVTAGGQAGARDLAGTVPVIFVHGINSSADMWKATVPGSLAWQTATTKGFTAWTFDYRHVSLDWVSNAAIGPALATAVGCLAQASGNKVIIVAHSMGGLAAQYAIGEPGSPAAGKVAEVITAGTPYTGSQILTDAQAVVNGTAAAEAESGDPAEAAVAEALLSACAGIATHTDSNPCSIVSALKSPVGTALEVDSAPIAALPPWPAALPVLDVAGNMDLFVGAGLIGFHAHPGDIAVTLPSATGHDTAPGPFVLPCSASLLSLLAQRKLPDCYHGNLVNQPTVIAEILSAVRKFTPAAGAGQAARGTALPASSWQPVGGATLTTQPGGVFEVQYDPTYWGGAIAHTDAGCNYTFSGQGRVLSGGGYGMTVWASVDQDGTPHGQAIQYDMGEDGYRDTALPENSETGSVYPAPLDGNWHRVSVQVLDGRYTSSVDGKVIFTGTMTDPCTSDVFIRLWNSTDAEFRDMTVTPLG
jgi:pimeloyl-ACP methyl ester carboxylesterase